MHRITFTFIHFNHQSLSWRTRGLLVCVPDGNKITCFNESKSYSAHIVSFILLHFQFLKKPVRRKYSTDMFCKYFRKLRLTKKSRIMKLKLFKVSISFLQGRLWQVFRVEGRAQRLVNCQAGLLLPMNALVACMIHNAWNTLKTYPDCKSIQSCKYITIHIQWTCVLFFKQ